MQECRRRIRPEKRVIHLGNHPAGWKRRLEPNRRDDSRRYHSKAERGYLKAADLRRKTGRRNLHFRSAGRWTVWSRCSMPRWRPDYQDGTKPENNQRFGILEKTPMKRIQTDAAPCKLRGCRWHSRQPGPAGARCMFPSCGSRHFQSGWLMWEPRAGIRDRGQRDPAGSRPASEGK